MEVALAIDMGASSARMALGRLDGGAIRLEMQERIHHEPRLEAGRLIWDLEALLGLCRRGADLIAEKYPGASLGIDTWGVDYGLVGDDGALLGPVACYRDTSHADWFARLADRRAWLYSLTGVQHQPFNTYYQLAARLDREPGLAALIRHLLTLPDLLGYLLGAKPFWEATEASTTQMVGLDGCWSRPILDSLGIGQIADQPQLPGGAPEELPGCGGRALLAHVGSHDTASAVFGLGLERPDQVFLSVGTWSLVGCVVDEPIATPEAEAANLTNERTVDGRIRLLANVPGFYVVNRLHEELGIARSVPDWLATATPEKAPRVDLTCPDLFNPVSMKDTLLGLCERGPKDEREWAGLALGSMADCVAAHVQILECVTGRRFAEIRAGGGGCQSAAFCSTLASATGMKVVTGPVEATVLGNLAMQFVSRGVLADLDEAGKVLRATAELS